MVRLIITPDIASALENISPESRNELSLPAPAVHFPITHAQLIALSRHLLSRDIGGKGACSRPTDSCNGSYSLNALLRGTRVYVPPPPPKPEPSPEYLALKAQLQAAAEANEYNNLLRPSHNANPTIGQTLNDADNPTDSDPLTPSLVFNILVSVLFTGFATYWALSNFRIPAFLTFSTSARGVTYPGSVSSQPARVFLALFVALVVVIAEVVVYAAYLRKVHIAKGKEKRIAEKKVFIGEVGLQDGGDDREVREDVSIDRKVGEEIWGRGPNGGARRRVKERWKGRENKSM